MPSLGASSSAACFCVGPQNGEPMCPCMMRNVERRDGRYVKPEIDLGPITPTVGKIEIGPIGCICPPTSEKTCQRPDCPRKSWTQGE